MTRSRPPLVGSRRGQRGSSFADVMMATVVVSTTIVASMSTVQDAAKTYDYFANGPYTALMVAQEIHEAALLLPWEADPEQTEGLYGPDVYQLQDLDEKSFTPARSADYETIINPVNWTQEVFINEVDPDDPAIPASFDPEALYELEVYVLDAAENEVGHFTWWMSPPE